MGPLSYPHRRRRQHYETGGTTLSVARAIYLRLRDGVPLWVAGREFRPADREQIRRSLAA
jgi:hypothetical protein